jgi:hypothetical protein
MVVTGSGEYVYFTDITTVNTELRGGTWTLQTADASVFVTQEVSTVPFFRLDLDPGEVFYTANTWGEADAAHGITRTFLFFLFFRITVSPLLLTACTIYSN